MDAKVSVGVGMGWTVGSYSHDGRVGAAAVFKYRSQWRSRHSYLDNRWLEIFDTALWPIGLALNVMILYRGPR
jgi:hypothetical protein